MPELTPAYTSSPWGLPPEAKGSCSLGDNALRAADPHARTYFSVQRHHPDGQRWFEVGRFATRQIAQLTLDALVAHGQGEARDFRVKRVTLPDGRAQSGLLTRGRTGCSPS